MKKNIKELREKYISNPPEGMTSEDIRHMSEDDLLDMDYFLNEDVWDNLMRIKNIDVAAELLEIGFGRSDRIYSRM